MAAVTFALTSIATVQYMSLDCPLRGFDMPGDMEPLPYLLVWVLNGPAFLRPFSVYRLVFPFSGTYIELSWLPAVIILWFVIGIGIDWRLKRPGRRIIRPKWVRVVAFLVPLILCILFLYAEFLHLRTHVMEPTSEWFMNEVRRYGWWTPNLSSFPRLAWTLAGIAYFSTKLWKTIACPQHNMILTEN